MRNIQLSSDELNEVNLQLEHLNGSIKAMLESIGQGFLFFNKDGVCAPIFSRACLDLIGKNPSEKHIVDVLELDEEKSANLRSLVELVFDENRVALPFEELMKLAPRRYTNRNGRIISLAYRPMHGGKKNIIGALVIATDITQEIENQKKLEEQRQEVSRILRIAKNKDDYLRYIQNFSAAIATIDKERPFDEIKRDIHTLKGMAKVFSFDDLAEALHDLESDLRRIPPEEKFENILSVVQRHLPALEESLDNARKYGHEMWGSDFEEQNESISVGIDRLVAFGRKLRDTPRDQFDPENLARDYFNDIAAVSVHRLMPMFENQLTYFAGMAGKCISIAYSKEKEVRVLPTPYMGVFDAFVHIARNIVDHAAEDPEERIKRGKSPELQVSIEADYCDEEKKTFHVVISDDGNGISADRVATKLKKRAPGINVDEMSRDDLIQHIFDIGFSTRDSVSISSGRGVGLNAVKVEAEKIGGTVRVSSEEGRYTSFYLCLPILWD